MTSPDLTSEETIRAFASDSFTCSGTRWNTLQKAELYYQKKCDALLIRDMNLNSSIVWDHYGSGYASYIDAWFYRNTADFELPPMDGCVGFVGLWVLLHRQCPVFVMGQGEKYWKESGGSSYLPRMIDVDDFSSQAVRILSDEVEKKLSLTRLVRLRRDQLQEPIPSDIAIDTFLASGTYSVFDALFHWND